MVIGSGDLSHEIMLNDNEISSSNEEKLLGIFLDNKPNFESHIGSLCRKAGKKINTLARLKNYLKSDQRNLLLNSFITSSFTYCPLIWMFMSCYLNNALNNIHEWALRLICNKNEKSFNSILTENNKKNLNFLQLKYRNFKMACLRQSWMIFSSQGKTFIISKSFRTFPLQLDTLWISVQKPSFIEAHNYGT